MTRENPLAALAMYEIALLIGAVLVTIPLFVIVHRTLDKIMISYVKRYCQTHAIEVSEWRISPAFDPRGTKTESTQIEVLSSAMDNSKRIYRFIVWPFGIRSVSESSFNPKPEDEDVAADRQPLDKINPNGPAMTRRQD